MRYALPYSVESPVERAIREGSIVGFANHTVLPEIALAKIRQDAPFRRFIDTVSMAEWSLAGECQTYQPVQEHRILGVHHSLQGAQLWNSRRCEPDPVLRRQVLVIGDEPDLGGAGRDRRDRQPQVTPGR